MTPLPPAAATTGGGAAPPLSALAALTLPSPASAARPTPALCCAVPAGLQEMNMPHAKLIVFAFSVSGFTIADPEDPGMLDVAGMDSAVPRLAADFALGRV